jgi:hypothetical protein
MEEGGERASSPGQPLRWGSRDAAGRCGTRRSAERHGGGVRWGTSVVSHLSVRWGNESGCRAPKKIRSGSDHWGDASSSGRPRRRPGKGCDGRLHHSGGRRWGTRVRDLWGGPARDAATERLSAMAVEGGGGRRGEDVHQWPVERMRNI